MGRLALPILISMALLPLFGAVVLRMGGVDWTPPLVAGRHQRAASRAKAKKGDKEGADADLAAARRIDPNIGRQARRPRLDPKRKYPCNIPTRLLRSVSEL
jgi:hypothetical protein